MNNIFSKKILRLGIIVFTIIALNACATSFMDSANEVAIQYNKKATQMSEISSLSSMVQLKDCGIPSVIKDVDRIFSWKNSLYVFDDTYDIITRNDMNGNLLSSTYKYIGHGRNEYIHLSDVALDETSGLIYALSDTPREIIVFDDNLNIKSIQPIDFTPVEMCIDSTHIMFLCRNYKSNRNEILCLAKNNLKAKPKVIISHKMVVSRIMGYGRCMTFTNRECWASLPFDNCIYKISQGEVNKTYRIDFEENWYKDEGYSPRQFLKENSNRVWSILNIQKCGEYLWFNTNTEGLYRLDTEKDKCICFNTIIQDSIPFATQLIIPQQGLSDKLAFRIIPAFVYSYQRNIERDHLEKEEGRIYTIAMENLKEKNALIAFWNMKN